MSKPEKTEIEMQVVLNPEPEDPALFAFLADLGVPLDSVKVRACYGVGGKDLGPVVFAREFKPNDKMFSEENPGQPALVALANIILQKARLDCQALGKKQIYSVLAYNNQKGANAFARHLLALTPGPREYLEHAAVPADEDTGDDATTVKGMLRELYRDRRYHQEHVTRMFDSYQSAVDLLIGKYENRLSATESVNAELLKTHAEMVKIREDLLDRKSKRELEERKETFKQSQIEAGVEMLKGLLPAVSAYLSRGKIGVSEGIKQFALSLDQAQRDQLFGVLDETGQHFSKPGLLDEQQVGLFVGIVEERISPEHIAGFIASLTPQQMMGAQSILRQDQLVALMSVADAIKKSANGAAA